MIRREYIRDHGLELPDIADFPGAGHTLFPEGKIDFRPYQKQFNDAIRSWAHNAFCTLYERLADEIQRHVSLTAKEQDILAEQIRRVKQASGIYFDSCRNQVERTDLSNTELYQRLDSEGSSPFKIDPTSIKTIRSTLESDIEQLASRDPAPKPHSYDRFRLYTRAEKPILFQLVEKLFREKGVLQAASKYNRRKGNLAIHSIALHIATPMDKHHYQTLLDLPTVSKLTSLHMDPKFNLVKALLYLSDVTPDSGPFTVVPRSNRWFYDPLERVVACGNSTGNYLDSPAHRKVLLMFPKTLRKNVILGRYILDGTPTSTMLLGQLHQYTSEEADCILFDPTQTLHRGGLCRSGNRINLQVLMR